MSASENCYCRICLKSGTINSFPVISLNSRIVSRIFESYILPKIIHICMWCKAALKTTYKLIKTVEQSQKILIENEEFQNQMPIKTETNHLKYGPYRMTYIYNSHEDILPIKYEELSHRETPTEEIRTVIEEKNIEEIGFNDENFFEETNGDVKEFGSKKCKQFKFEVKYLSCEEQFGEIELKKNTEKYKQMKYHCEKCGTGFLTSDVFEEHLKRHSELTNYKCSICLLHFKSKDVLSQHALAHSRKFICTICGASFNRWRLCVLHRYKCDGIQNTVICTLCKKVFSNSISLDIHTKGVHKKEKKYACSQCAGRFVTKQRLTVHERTHSGTRLFSCIICSRSFTTKSNLNAHQNVHNEGKSHYCVECNLYYKSVKGLKRHFRESPRHVDKNELRYKCPRSDCPKRFSSESMLKSHITSRHLTTYPCSICNKKFSSNTNLRKHERCVHTG